MDIKNSSVNVTYSWLKGGLKNLYILSVYKSSFSHLYGLKIIFPFFAFWVIFHGKIKVLEDGKSGLM